MKTMALRLALLLTGLLSITVSSVSAQTTSDLTVAKAVAPNFPSLARAARVLGNAIVKVTINSKGEVVDMKLISGNPLLKATSLRAAKNWIFSPSSEKERFVELEFIYTDAAVKEDAGVFFMPPFKVEISDYPPSIDFTKQKDARPRN